MIKRRRFLAISCAAMGTGLQAASSPMRWTGIALGAEASITIEGGDVPRARRVLDRALDQIAHIEKMFSLFDPSSTVSRLNRDGILYAPHPDFVSLLRQVTKLHAYTSGLFDPTVQVIWDKHANSEDTSAPQAPASLGWQRVAYDNDVVRLGSGQQVTFNGVAQGVATDKVTEILRQEGFGNILVNIGEHVAHGTPRRLGLSDPNHAYIGNVTLKDAAIATSSPMATTVNGAGHIFSPKGKAPYWSTASVIANTATIADGLSTAICLADIQQVKNVAKMPEVHRVLLVNQNGDLMTVN